jgi:hypothetical protein
MLAKVWAIDTMIEEGSIHPSGRVLSLWGNRRSGALVSIQRNTHRGLLQYLPH